ncbi:MAG: hypothetical protein IJP81_04700 [Bacteroidales bacterium]|nr:hypothetical protein [Bacteroidales bacterium]
MDKLDKLPELVKKGILKFLEEIPVEKYSDQWRAIQAAITMIVAPNSFKDKVHVYLRSHEGGREEGAYNSHTMSIKIWPHKLQMSRDNQEWTSWSGYTTNEHYRYTFPGGKHSVSEFEELLSNTGGLFYSNYSDWNHDGGQSSGIYANFTIETNAK